MSIHAMRPPGSVLATGLQAFVDTLPPGLLMAEIGSYTGESLAFFLQKASMVICVDRWLDYVEQVGETPGRVVVDQMQWVEDAFDRVASFYGERVVKVKADSLETAARCPDGTFDLVYIDAGHGYADVKSDLIAWWPKIKPGGLLAGHDYDPIRSGLRRAVDEYCGPPDKVYPDSTWVVRMTPAMIARLRERGKDGAEGTHWDSLSNDRGIQAV